MNWTANKTKGGAWHVYVGRGMYGAFDHTAPRSAPSSSLRRLGIHMNVIMRSAAERGDQYLGWQNNDGSPKRNPLIAPIFDLFEFHVKAEWRREGRPEKITKPKDIYLTDQEEDVAKFFEECDKEHRKHGFNGPKIIPQKNARPPHGRLPQGAISDPRQPL